MATYVFIAEPPVYDAIVAFTTDNFILNLASISYAETLENVLLQGSGLFGTAPTLQYSVTLGTVSFGYSPGTFGTINYGLTISNAFGMPVLYGAPFFTVNAVGTPIVEWKVTPADTLTIPAFGFTTLINIPIPQVIVGSGNWTADSGNILASGSVVGGGSWEASGTFQVAAPSGTFTWTNTSNGSVIAIIAGGTVTDVQSNGLDVASQGDITCAVFQGNQLVITYQRPPLLYVMH